MSLNPRTVKLPNGRWAVEWDPDPTAEGYAFVTPNGSGRTFSVDQTRALLARGIAEPFSVAVSALDIIGRPAEIAYSDADPNDPPYPWVVAPPRDPISVGPAAGEILGINATRRGSWHDWRIADTGDSGVLVQPGAAGSTFARIDQERVGGTGVDWATHGWYVKAEDVLVEDTRTRCLPSAKAIISLRCSGIIVQRFVGDCPNGFVGSYYENSTRAGEVLIQQGRASFNSDTAFWLGQPQIGATINQRFTLRDLEVTGPASAKFLRTDPKLWRPGSSVDVVRCVLNGRAVVASDIVGIAARIS